ncbi:MAG: GNAT family N-acetyltransferase [Ruminococcus sp.]|nr:GNAT family N-acetyltransferase [Ruminococcus sp.]
MEGTVYSFLSQCFPESGRLFELNGKHSFYNDIPGYFEFFLCLFCNEDLIGTVAVKRLNDTDSELKSLYLFKAYQGKGLGYKLLTEAISFAASNGYSRMYLDSMSTSTKAIRLYRRAGFRDTERYNDNQKADVFMVLDLASGSDKT